MEQVLVKKKAPEVEDIVGINQVSFKERIASYKKHPGSFVLLLCVCLAMLLTIASLGYLILYIVIKGVPYLTPSLFAWEYTSDNVSMLPSLINTVLMTLLSLLIDLAEYAKKGNKIVGIVRVTAETLTGIPSIVYGLFGMLFFVTACKWRLSLLSGAFTLAIMVLPVIMRTTEEALMSVPDSYRQGSLGLGAGKLRTVFRVVLPSAIPGILSGVVLAIGRIVGETAALIYTAGSVAKIPQFSNGAKFLFDSTRTLSVHMYNLSKEGLHTNQAYATAVVLMIVVMCMNFLSDLLANKLAKKSGGEK